MARECTCSGTGVCSFPACGSYSRPAAPVSAPVTEGWAAVVLHLSAAQQAAKGLDRSRHPRNWDSYVDEIDCASALETLIDSAQCELKSSQPEPPGNPQIVKGAN